MPPAIDTVYGGVCLGVNPPVGNTLATPITYEVAGRQYAGIATCHALLVVGLRD